ncbi:hypothetical protein U717_12915 [Rhodobacter capsulatus R121]|nr:hypothetical protein U714_12755 [Rhodobacter capsulatus DE442]ETD75694.1 hypothetical protein U717_12915 [Rhodobacter capsulatus R121]ETE53326.1 hypothetical protein U715_12915 [Rhodobacter capsulatus Y262]
MHTEYRFSAGCAEPFGHPLRWTGNHPRKTDMDHIPYTGLGGILVLVLDLWALISVLGARVSTGQKLLWVLLILLLPVLGFVVWLLAGPRSSSASA